MSELELDTPEMRMQREELKVVLQDLFEYKGFQMPSDESRKSIAKVLDPTFDRDPSEEEYLMLLGSLVGDYGKEHWPLPDPNVEQPINGTGGAKFPLGTQVTVNNGVTGTSSQVTRPVRKVAVCTVNEPIERITFYNRLNIVHYAPPERGSRYLLPDKDTCYELPEGIEVTHMYVYPVGVEWRGKKG